jgi:hypothetical protein
MERKIMYGIGALIVATVLYLILQVLRAPKA